MEGGLQLSLPRRRSRCVGRLQLVETLLRLAAEDVIVARGRSILRRLPAQRAHEGYEPPHLIVRNPAAPRRHAVRSSLYDRREDLCRITSVDPLVIHQRRTHPAAAVTVAADTVELIEQHLPLGDCICVVLIGDSRLRYLMHRSRLK